MRIVYGFGGKETVFERDVSQVIIGRPKHGVVIDLDLSPDQTVSRPHARVWVEDGTHFIEDLNSTGGTLIAGEEIRGKGPRRLHPSEVVRLGETSLRVEFAAPDSPASTRGTAVPAPGIEPADITARLDAVATVFTPAEIATAETSRRLALLYELPLAFGAASGLEGLLQTIVERTVAGIPRAMRGALLVKDRVTGDLLLKAHVPTGMPAVSTSLTQQAMDERQAFVWRRGAGDVTVTQSEYRMESGMYAPLLWKDEVLGVVCVDNFETANAFDAEDLRLMVAVAQHSSLAVVHHLLQDDLRRNASLTSRLLANFSPKIQERLLDQARRGRLRLGGEKSEVTVVVTDIRGFTEMSAGMDAEDVVDILNAYFPPLIDAVFAYDGTIDKFLGDAILAVFGSPEADAHHHEKALRAAMAMQAAAQGLSTARATRGQAVCDIGIGVHCGEVFHGFIGSNERLEYTVIGDAVNRAKRYCDGAGAGEVLISADLHQWIWHLVQSEPVTVKTKHEGDWPALRIKAVRGK